MNTYYTVHVFHCMSTMATGENTLYMEQLCPSGLFIIYDSTKFCHFLYFNAVYS